MEPSPAPVQSTDAPPAGSGAEPVPAILRPPGTQDRAPDQTGRSRLIAIFSIGFTLSIAAHAALIGFGLIHLSPRPPSNEEALPVTIVHDEPPPDKPKELPKPDSTPAPDSPLPAPSQPEATPQQPRQKEIPSPETAAAPATVAPPPPDSGHSLGAVAEKNAKDVASMLRQAIMRCWSAPAGWTSPRQVTVVVDVRLDRSGALSGRPVLIEFAASELGMAAAKSALAAVARCAPYKLPPEKYNQWREAEIRLAPD